MSTKSCPTPGLEKDAMFIDMEYLFAGEIGHKFVRQAGKEITIRSLVYNPRNFDTDFNCDVTIIRNMLQIAAMFEQSFKASDQVHVHHRWLVGRVSDIFSTPAQSIELRHSIRALFVPDMQQMTITAWMNPGMYPSNVRMMFRKNCQPSPWSNQTPRGGIKYDMITKKTSDK